MEVGTSPTLRSRQLGGPASHLSFTRRARGFAMTLLNSNLLPELRQHGDVVGGLVEAAHIFVDAGRNEAVGRLGRQQDMVYPDAVVLAPGARLVIPEGVRP